MWKVIFTPSHMWSGPYRNDLHSHMLKLNIALQIAYILLARKPLFSWLLSKLHPQLDLSPSLKKKTSLKKNSSNKAIAKNLLT